MDKKEATRSYDRVTKDPEYNLMYMQIKIEMNTNSVNDNRQIRCVTKCYGEATSFFNLRLEIFCANTNA